MAIPSVPLAPLAPLFNIERSRLLELLQSIAPDDWDRPTPCPGWSVLGLATHILGGDLGLLARMRDGHHGTPAPDGIDETAFIAWLDDLQMGWVTAARRLSPRVVVEMLAWSGPQVSEMISQQDPTERLAAVSWASVEPVPRWLDQSRELSEWWIHRQQLREALDEVADLRIDVAAVVLDGLKWAYPRRLSTLDRPIGTTALIEVSGHDLDVDWLFELTPQGWEQVEANDTNRGARLALTADEAWRLLTNNLGDAAKRQLRASGDPEIVQTLIDARAIIGSPK